MARVRVYTTDWCWFCRTAEKLLRDKGVDYERIDVSGDRATRAWLAGATGRRTVPQIFIDDDPIGGCRELEALERSGRLDQLLAA